MGAVNCKNFSSSKTSNESSGPVSSSSECYNNIFNFFRNFNLSADNDWLLIQKSINLITLHKLESLYQFNFMLSNHTLKITVDCGNIERKEL